MPGLLLFLPDLLILLVLHLLLLPHGALVVVPLVVIFAEGLAELVPLIDLVAYLLAEGVAFLEELLGDLTVPRGLVEDDLEGGGPLVDLLLDGVDLLVLLPHGGGHDLALLLGVGDCDVLGLDLGNHRLGGLERLDLLEELLLGGEGHGGGLLLLLELANFLLDVLEAGEAEAAAGGLLLVHELVRLGAGDIKAGAEGFLFVDKRSLGGAEGLEGVLFGLGGGVALGADVAIDLVLELLPLCLELVDGGVEGCNFRLVLSLVGPGNVGDRLGEVVELLDGGLFAVGVAVAVAALAAGALALLALLGGLVIRGFLLGSGLLGRGGGRGGGGFLVGHGIGRGCWLGRGGGRSSRNAMEIVRNYQC